MNTEGDTLSSVSKSDQHLKIHSDNSKDLFSFPWINWAIHDRESQYRHHVASIVEESSWRYNQQQIIEQS